MASTNSQIVTRLLQNATNPEVVRELVAPDATYVSLNQHNPDLTRIMPWCGSHPSAGPDAIVETFRRVQNYWTVKDFQTDATFGEGEHVAVFGRFTYSSTVMGKSVTSPFAVWCRLNQDGQIGYMQFMEDTLATRESFKKSGRVLYASNPKGGEVAIE
ncbi:MAG: hypothetical protein M1828_007064 [Chrysothrix sp. TS-e1954]|nr:MAG: hypothetical protein M1828_007064 [Chrysothrix sp. TS-e1954]